MHLGQVPVKLVFSGQQMCIFHPHRSIGLWYSLSCVLFSPLLFNIPILGADFLELSNVCCPSLGLGVINTTHCETQSWILSKFISGSAPTPRAQPELGDGLHLHRQVLQTLNFSLGMLPARFERQDWTVHVDTEKWVAIANKGVAKNTPLKLLKRTGGKPCVTSHPKKWCLDKLGRKIWSFVLKSKLPSASWVWPWVGEPSQE